MRSDTAAGRMRLVISLAVVSAAAVLLGLILVVMSTAAHVVSRRPAGHVTALGLALGAAGIVVGLVAMLMVAFTRAGRSTRGQGGSRQAGTDRRPPAAHRHRASAPAGQDRDRARDGAAERGPGQPSRDSRSRPRRDQVLTPATVYSPRGLRDVPRDARAREHAGTPRAAPPPEPAAGVPPPPRPYRPGPSGPQGSRGGSGRPVAAGASRSGHDEDRIWAGRMAGPPPRRPSYQPGPYAADPGWGPPPAQPARPSQQPQQPQQPMGPPHDRMRAREAYPPRHAPPPRDVPPLREAPATREAAMPRDLSRPGTPMPPRGTFQPGYPSRSGRAPGSTGGRPPAGPGHAPSGGQWPTGSRAAPNAAGAYGTFDGGYAQVIPAADNPARPDGRTRPAHPGRPAGPVGPASPAPADADVFVYRDPSTPSAAPPPGPPAPDPAEHDTAYWYGLLTEDTGLRHEETRGPFEPLHSSSGTASGPGAAATGTEPAGTGPGQASSDDTAQARARNLEQLKDLYLTAEAIGEENVDKHFDHLLAQQRELISQYFRQSAVAGPEASRAVHERLSAGQEPSGERAERLR